MSDSLPDMTAAPVTITIGGTPYRIASLSFSALAELEVWLNRQLPDPRAIAREMIESGLSDAVAEKVALEAFRVARQGAVKINSPEAAAILGSPAGSIQVLYHALRRHQPGIMVADVERIMDQMTPGEYEAIERHIYGDEGDDGPKARATKVKRRTPSGVPSSSV
jgi:hypothetical protein